MPGARRETGSLDRLNSCMHNSSAAADGGTGDAVDGRGVHVAAEHPDLDRDIQELQRKMGITDEQVC